MGDSNAKEEGQALGRQRWTRPSLCPQTPAGSNTAVTRDGLPGTGWEAAERSEETSQR